MITQLCRKLDFSTMATPHLHKRQIKKMLKDAKWASLGFVIYICCRCKKHKKTLGGIQTTLNLAANQHRLFAALTWKILNRNYSSIQAGSHKWRVSVVCGWNHLLEIFCGFKSVTPHTGKHKTLNQCCFNVWSAS